MLWVWIILGTLIIVVLAVVAYRLQTQVWRIEAAKAKQAELVEVRKQQKRNEMNKSIQVLAQGMLDQQLSKTEGAIRISALLAFLSIDDNEKGNALRQDYSALFQLAEASAHIPILDQWKALPRQEKQRYDKEREGLEERFGDFVLDAAERLLGKHF